MQTQSQLLDSATVAKWILENTSRSGNYVSINVIYNSRQWLFGQGVGSSQLTPGWNPSPTMMDMLSSLMRSDQATAHWTTGSQLQEGIPQTACFGWKLFWVHILLKAPELRSWGNCGPQKDSMSITRDWLEMQIAGPLPRHTESKSRGRTHQSVGTSPPRRYAQVWETLT